MDRTECHYHGSKTAEWHCHTCARDFCNTCVPAGHSEHWGVRGPKCALCNKPLDYLGPAVSARPFWQMLPQFFLYPLQLPCLSLIALVAIAAPLLPGELFSLFLGIFAAAVIVKYGFAIIEKRAAGDKRAPSISQVIAGDEHHLFLKQMAVLVLMGAAIGFAMQTAPWLGLLVGGFVALALPANTILLAVEKSVFRSINPLVLLSLMFTIGWPYLLLWFGVQVISSGPMYIFSWLGGALPVSMVLPVTIAVTLYFSFVTYCMLGYVLHQYQHELGYQSEAEDEPSISEKEFDRLRALAEVSILIQENAYDQARHLLRAALDRVKDDTELHDRYHRLLLLLNDKTALTNHGNYFAGLLCRYGQTAKAATVYTDIQQQIADFQLSDVKVACAVAEALITHGKPALVLRLLHNIHKKHPGHADIPRAYLLIAKVYVEHLGQDAKALQVLQFLLKQFPGTPLKDDISSYLNTVRKLSAGSVNPA